MGAATLPRRIIPTVAGAVLMCLAVPVPAPAQFFLSGHLGNTHTPDSDVRLLRPDGTDLTFHDPDWAADAFEMPPYYEGRLTYWRRQNPKWGFTLSLVHPRIRSRLHREVRTSGIRAGNAVAGTETIGDTFDRLEFSHGNNTISAGVARRWRRTRWLRPYVGLAAGVAYPNVEVELNGAITNEFQLAGPAVRAISGVEISRPGFGWVLHTGINVGWVDIDADLETAGSVELDPVTIELAIGIGRRIGRAGPQRAKG